MISGSDTLFVKKELSWLSYNESVLQETSDASVPVVERVRFQGIYANNMDEFFRLRTAAVRRPLQLGSFSTTLEKDRHLLQKNQTKVLLLQEKFDAIGAELMHDDTTYLAVSLNSEHQRQYALIEIAAKNVPGFIALPPVQTKRKNHLILLNYLQNREKILAATIALMDEDVDSGCRHAVEPVIAADGSGGLPFNDQEKAR